LKARFCRPPVPSPSSSSCRVPPAMVKVLLLRALTPRTRRFAPGSKTSCPAKPELLPERLTVPL